MAAPSSAEKIDYTDIENHEFAQYILREHGTYFPKWASADVVILGNAHNHAQSRGYVRIRRVGTKHETTNRSVAGAAHRRTRETIRASSRAVPRRCVGSVRGAK